MITQELTAYVKSELNKGKSKEEIRGNLLSGGGWSDADVMEVFKAVMPAESMTMNIPASTPNIITPNPMSHSVMPEHSFVVPSPVKKKRSFPWKFLIFILILGVLGFAGWYYRSYLSSIPDQINSLFVKNNVVQKPVVPTPPPQPVIPPTPSAPVEPTPTIEPTPVVVDTTPVFCGATAQIDRKSTANVVDSALFCLGQNAMKCANAKLVINDPFFPNLLEISNKNNSCDFTLSYPSDSTLVDVTGKKLAGRSMTCPLSVVKTMDESNPKNIVFKAPNTTDGVKYAKDIYVYGTLGLFINNNFDQMKIEGMGCSGTFLNSVIESYKLMKK